VADIGLSVIEFINFAHRAKGKLSKVYCEVINVVVYILFAERQNWPKMIINSVF
jgi:hypothetical protein